ncbi:single-stranded DNA-binding protein [Bradyrhizobium japonicum]|uniref:single-stranded DNA-binding protein n=1 Tax=Bradyrhizobium japonicum TaxID=375 RepID=UPI00222639A9|nr:single-stranded DNA-binding protein [Bradyrhizobium japonicum]MCW2218317.1 single-stranded DNA-binding protein [Bradyrhizobium japonicum]MCW2342931.1 single-stranded DNA-binding protein [Bradyrhizobium japonicum]
MIECAFYGFLAADAEARTSQAGKQWARLRVGVGKDDAMQWVSVAVFGKAAETAAQLKKGDRCYCEGAIKLESWRGNDGADRHGLAVTSFKIEKTHQIGRNKPPKQEKPASAPSGRARASTSDYAPIGSGAAGLNDDIPFAPEVR